MSKIDDGGAAFPQNDAGVNRINNHDGMTLRDWFAGQYLVGAAMLPYEKYADLEGDVSYNEHFAKQAYAAADVMIKERSK